MFICSCACPVYTLLMCLPSIHPPHYIVYYIMCIHGPRGVDNEAVFEVPYDVLIVGVGAINNTFNIPGVEQHCYFLKVPCW